MQTYHAEAIVNQEGQILLSLPFPIGEKVNIVVMPSDDNAQEAQRRSDAVNRGEMKTVEGPEALARVRKLIGH